MKTLILLLSLTFCINAFATLTKEQHYNELFKRQELIHKSYQTIYLTLTDINKREAIQSWYRLLFQNKDYVKIYTDVEKSLANSVLGEDYRLLLFYYVATGQIDQATQTLGFYFISLHTLIDNIVHDPQVMKSHPIMYKEVSTLHTALDLSKVRELESCFQNKMKPGSVRSFELNNINNLRRTIYKCAFNKEWFQTKIKTLKLIFEDYKFSGAPFPISFAGYVGGNDVTLHNQLPMDNYSIMSLGNQLHLLQNAMAPGLGKPYSQLSTEEFKQLMPTPQSAINDFFTRKEGFKNTTRWDSLFDADHSTLGPVSSQRLGIYGSMLQAIRDAEESVFIDIFWIGGTIGMNLAKELFSKVIENPDFQVVIISDNENKFNYGPELDMIYNYMRAFSEKFNHLNFYLTPAQIGLKRTALPEFVDLLITQNVVNDLSANKNLKSFLENDGFHLLAKSDHSKVIIVDGKNPHLGKAFVGSKNWTDSSGGINYDEVAEVQGPAAALILNSFYYDMLEAFTLDLDPDLGGQMVQNHIDVKYPELKQRKAIEKLIAPFDVVGRHASSSIDLEYVEKGESYVAPAENNINGTEMSALEQNIQVILNAKHQILIDDQFLYDPYIIEALKVARVLNGVEIFVILESLSSFIEENRPGMHIPNNLFIPELLKMGAQVKWKKTPQSMLDAINKDHRRHPAQLIGATFHMKSLAADGVMAQDVDSCNSDNIVFSQSNNSAPVLITGSANKDVMTMSGGFREYQVAVFDQSTVATHDCLFWARWNNPGLTESTDGLDFELPEQAHQLGITDKESFLNFIKQVFFAPYRFTKDFF